MKERTLERSLLSLLVTTFGLAIAAILILSFWSAQRALDAEVERAFARGHRSAEAVSTRYLQVTSQFLADLAADSKLLAAIEAKARERAARRLRTRAGSEAGSRVDAWLVFRGQEEAPWLSSTSPLLGLEAEGQKELSRLRLEGASRWRLLKLTVRGGSRLVLAQLHPLVLADGRVGGRILSVVVLDSKLSLINEIAQGAGVRAASLSFAGESVISTEPPGDPIGAHLEASVKDSPRQIREGGGLWFRGQALSWEPLEGTPRATLHLALPATGVAGVQADYLRLGIVSLALILLLALWVSGRVLRYLAQPLEQLVAMAGEASGDRALEYQAGEIAEFNALGQTLVGLVSEARMREAKLTKLFESAPAPLLVFGPGGRLQRFNASALEFLGLDPEAAGSEGASLFPEVLAQALERAFAGERSSDLEASFGEHTLLFSLAPVRLDEALVGVFVQGQDITDRVRAAEEQQRYQAELSQLQRLETVGGLAACVAHDFNNLLGAIMGFASLAELQSGEELKESLHQICKASDRGVALVKRLLNLSRSLPLERRPVALNEVVKEVLPLLRSLAPDRSKVLFEPGEDLPSISTDPLGVEQILLNLCTNAFDAMPGGGRVWIRTFTCEDPDFCVLSVQDEGEGVPAELREQILVPFFTTKPAGRGTGLGLATVSRVLAELEGKLELRSELGKGTTFELRLPLAAKPTPPTEHLPEAVLEGTRLLLADDDAALLETTSKLLSKVGYVVTTARDGLEAVELFREAPDSFDLVLLDVSMPRLGGREAAEEILKLRELPLVFYSGFAPSAEGFPSRILPKPISLPALDEALRAALAREAL